MIMFLCSSSCRSGSSSSSSSSSILDMIVHRNDRIRKEWYLIGCFGPYPGFIGQKLTE